MINQFQLAALQIADRHPVPIRIRVIIGAALVSAAFAIGVVVAPHLAIPPMQALHAMITESHSVTSDFVGQSQPTFSHGMFGSYGIVTPVISSSMM